MPARLVLPLLLVTLAGASPAPAQDFQTRWKARVEAFRAENARLPADQRHVVLLGSSSMEGWAQGGRVRRFLPTVGPRTLNRGISGDGIGISRTTGVANRLEVSAFDCRPSHVVLLNGRNSLGQGVARTAEVYRQVVTRLRRELPETVVVLVTCPPTRGQYAHLAGPTLELNQEIRRIARDLGCRLIDLHPLLVDADGRSMRPALTRDGLHFGDEGYRLLGQAIEAIVAEGGAPPPLPPEPEAEAAPAGAGAPGGLVGGLQR